MKKLMLTVCLVLGLLIMAAPMAMALKISTLSTLGPYQTGSGGEFSVVPSDGLEWVLNTGYVEGVTKNVLSGTFQTFCVEKNEYIYTPNVTYDVALSQKSIYNNKDLTKGAAWLYYEFTRGTSGALNGIYDFTNTSARKNDGTDVGSDNDLQQALWYYMGVDVDPDNLYTQKAELALGGEANALANNNSLYPVAVVNMWAEGHYGDINYRRQDQLVRVPEPGILILLGIAMSAIGAASWRLRKL